jgi:MoaA/NifB/PqqE/SkfB family radical SAM enzyme
VNNPMEMKVDFNESPSIWEATRTCDLACVHCRASAQSWRNPHELSTEEGKRLIDEVAAMNVPVFVLTGGDPLKRRDTFELVEYAASQGVRVSLTPSATPLLTDKAILRLKNSGLARLAISLDGRCRGSQPELSCAGEHSFRRVPGGRSNADQASTRNLGDFQFGGWFDGIASDTHR